LCFAEGRKNVRPNKAQTDQRHANYKWDCANDAVSSTSIGLKNSPKDVFIANHL
jgi:hypothetical protein